MAEGDYIKLNRSILTWEWYSDIPVRILFVHLLLSCRYAPGRWQGVDIEAGALPTSLPNLASATGLSLQQVRTALKKLESTGEITDLPTHSFRLITLRNWSKYQGGSTGKQQASNRQATDDQQTINSTIRREEGKKGRREEVRARAEAHTELVWPKFAGPQCRAKWAEFMEYRIREKRQRYKTTATEQKALDLAARYFPNGPHFVAALDHTMARTWVFPVDPSEYRYPFQQPSPQPNPIRNGRPQQYSSVEYLKQQVLDGHFGPIEGLDIEGHVSRPTTAPEDQGPCDADYTIVDRCDRSPDPAGADQ